MAAIKTGIHTRIVSLWLLDERRDDERRCQRVSNPPAR